jgi:hypothetical protein
MGREAEARCKMSCGLAGGELARTMACVVRPGLAAKTLDGLEGVERSDQHSLDVLGREHPRSGAIVRLNHPLDAHAMLSGRVAATHAGDKIVDDPASKSSLIVIGVLALARQLLTVLYVLPRVRTVTFAAVSQPMLVFTSPAIKYPAAILACSSAFVQYIQLIVYDQLELAH